MTDQTDRELRDALEATQTELAQSRGELERLRDELVASQAQCVSLKEEIEFLRWSLNGGERKGLLETLAETRAENARLKERLGTGPKRAVARRPGPRVCLVSIFQQGDQQAPGHSEYVAFEIGPDGASKDIVRSTRWEVAMEAAEQAADTLGVAVEDLS